MSHRFASRLRILTVAILLVCGYLRASQAGGPDANSILRRIEESLIRPDTLAVEASRRDTLKALDSVLSQLEERAIGVVFHEELGIDSLIAELSRPVLDAAALDACERRLRRVLVGEIRAPVSRLRSSLEKLACSVRLQAGDTEPVRTALRILTAPASETIRADDPEDERRQAFRTLVAFSPSRSELASLRRLLSAPNASTTVSASFVEVVSWRHFEQPVEIRECRDGATILGRGGVGISLHATAPPSEGMNRLVMHARGEGSIDATANRRRVHVRAVAKPTLVGAIELDLHADRIDDGSPRVAAVFHTRLSGLGIDGLVGRCRIVQRVAAEAIGRVLEAGDTTVARKLESEVAKRVDEEAYSLAHRINGLLHHGLWDRLASLDEMPEVRTWNDAAGLHATSYYGHDDRLGALEPAPPIPSVESFDIISRLHESAINNSLASLGGLRLDENTVRGVWEVQLKLRSQQWARLRAGRVPAEIRLADHDPAVVRLRDGRIDLGLRVVLPPDEGPDPEGKIMDVGFHYRLNRHPDGVSFTRSPFELVDGLPAEDMATLLRTLGLFFPESIEPMPRYRPSGFSQYLKTAHIDVSRGWLTVGASRVSSDGNTEKASRPREVRR